MKKKRYGQWSWEALHDRQVQYRAKHPSYVQRELMGEERSALYDHHHDALEDLRYGNTMRFKATTKLYDILAGSPRIRYLGEPLRLACELVVTFGGERCFRLLSRLFACEYCGNDLGQYPRDCGGCSCPEATLPIPQAVRELIWAKGAESYWTRGKKGQNTFFGLLELEFTEALKAAKKAAA